MFCLFHEDFLLKGIKGVVVNMCTDTVVKENFINEFKRAFLHTHSSILQF